MRFQFIFVASQTLSGGVPAFGTVDTRDLAVNQRNQMAKGYPWPVIVVGNNRILDRGIEQTVRKNIRLVRTCQRLTHRQMRRLDKDDPVYRAADKRIDRVLIGSRVPVRIDDQR